MNTFQPADRRTRGHRAAARQASPAPEHIAEHLQDDWFCQHFRHIGGVSPRLLRRAAALRLVQMSAGGSLAEAAAFLGIGRRYIAASPGSTFTAACLASDAGPAEFRLAVHALARQLSTTPDLINYKRRRDALQDWCIDPAAWQDIISQLPPTKGPFQPELSDCKRQFATEAVWARITQGEHVMAPQLIEPQPSRPDPTWSGDAATCGISTARARPSPTTPPSRRSSAPTPDNLAAQIDRAAPAWPHNNRSR